MISHRFFNSGRKVQPVHLALIQNLKEGILMAVELRQLIPSRVPFLAHSALKHQLTPNTSYFPPLAPFICRSPEEHAFFL